MESLGVSNLLGNGTNPSVDVLLAPLLKLQLSLVSSCKALFEVVDLCLGQQLLVLYSLHVYHSAHFKFLLKI